MALTKTFDPKNVSLIIGGYPVTGFSDGTFITVSADNDLWNKSVGADGEVVRIKSNNLTGSLSFTLQASSGANDVLSGFYTADLLSNSGIVPAICKDGNGTSLQFGAECWVRKIPDATYATDASTREWVLDIATLESFIGGTN